MKSEINTTEQLAETDRFTNLKTVTPFSKYLATGLFVLLPFVSGYVGYASAGESGGS